ncbi:MAG: UDP-N-acetylglucosamine 1-carboxyvinyltransferase [Desulfotalea sp.]|nr:MAG: UDP-N-acetylglucosamine 1-carboxyvinyltransferase [Desulfotalea sp.]
MKKYKITGGKRLTGKIRLHGAKNAAMPILAATVLTDEEIVLRNVPVYLNDVQVMLEILQSLGKKIEIKGEQVVISGSLHTHIVPPDLGNRIRYSLLFLGGLLNRFKKSSVPNPGGCNIGERKFDLHIEGLSRLGGHFELGETIEATCTSLKGNEINFYLPTTSGTQNIILGALAAEGETVLKNANTRPENMDFGDFLKSMGADLDIRNRVVKVRGSQMPLHGTDYTIMNGPDELVTYIIAAAITGGEIQIENANLKYAPTDFRVLRDAGVEIFEWGNSVYVSCREPLDPIDIFTTPYPGINSDMQPLYSVLASFIPGESTVTDMRFTDRFQYVEGLKKFGVDIDAYGDCAVIRGGKALKGVEVKATDLRGGAAMVLAGLGAVGTTTISNIYQIDRGYVNLAVILRSLGADIDEVEEG